MSVLKVQGALLRGTESLWIGVRKYSSTRAKKEASKRWVYEQNELLEVLEARVKQLQTDNVSEVVVDKVHVSPLRKSALLPPFPHRAAALSASEGAQTPKDEGKNSTQLSRWNEKLQKEDSQKRKRFLRLQNKILSVVTREQGKETQNSRVEKTTAKPKSQRPGPTKAYSSGKAAAAQQSPSCRNDGAKEKSLPKTESEVQHGNLQNSILSYLDTCLYLGQPERALNCLLFYHRSAVRRRLVDVRMYNLLLHDYAKKHDMMKVGHLFRLLEESGQKPNSDSYVAALSCMGRASARPKIITSCLQQLTKDGLRLEDLFRDTLYEGEEVEMALKAIQRVRPNFQMTPVSQAKTPHNPLLQDFYTKETPASYPKLDFTAQELQEKFQRQLEMELSDTVTIDSVEGTKPVSEKMMLARKLLADLRPRWQASLLQSLKESKMSLDQRNSGKLSLFPFLCVLKDEEYVDILMWSLSGLPAQGESLVVLSKRLGLEIYNKYLTRKKSRSPLVKKIQHLYRNYTQLLAKDTQVAGYLPREYWEKVALEAGWNPSLVVKEYAWPNSVLVQLGLHLVEMLVQVVKVENNIFRPGLEQKLIPVVYHVYSFRSGHQIGFIRPHPLLTRLFQDAAESTLTFEAFAIPMLCPPLPWVSCHFGTYIFSPTKLMRSLDGVVQHQLQLEKCPPGTLHPVLDALNLLGNCPWKINRAVLDIAIAIFNDKGNKKLDVPPPPSEAPQPVTHLPGGKPLSKMALRRELARCRKATVEMYSLRVSALYKLSIAKHVSDGVFWFPHNMDFRGRTYPCAPHFNHLGGDLMRAVLLFAEGKPLGPHGLDWLKIHLINLTGLKKRESLRSRLAYADQIMEDILDSADNPLTGKKWWMGMDEPWQVLACCMEIAKAVRSPDPVAYVSHFPVHQDGSCNGLQHYAALGRDVIGASSVNLAPSNVPQDVYSEVAAKVEMIRKQDAAMDVKIAQLLEGFISRKVVKQTVMTVVYGVTRYGGRLQIEKRLKEIEDFPQEYTWEASHYLVQLVFSSLQQMFSGTREIQAWLTESARLISKSGRTVEWVTPLGLPIIQPYHRTKNLVLKSSLQSVGLSSSYDVDQKPSTLKQKNAFPPNFIHSLDSTHMMLTALHCLRQGLTFVSVHDCYWTHALTVDIMNRICRDQFVALHKQPILEDLSRFMLQKYCTNLELAKKKKKTKTEQITLEQLLSEIPEKGDFNLENVKESTYFFS